MLIVPFGQGISMNTPKGSGAGAEGAGSSFGCSQSSNKTVDAKEPAKLRAVESVGYAARNRIWVRTTLPARFRKEKYLPCREVKGRTRRLVRKTMLSSIMRLYETNRSGSSFVSKLENA